ncbi:hypothetical protein GY45DRAFT_1318282 [Cubamyces sp. BRFM 1775]|nr:hypothetical protein GY45DRAFT_1318282 [Cubamyces sp. BRFM 1775]
MVGRPEDPSTDRSKTCGDQQGSDESPTANPLRALPLELADAILEHASHDKATLSACTLVSHVWRDLARPHLFSFLTVACQETFDDFDGFLGSHPDIARLVRRLELRPLPMTLFHETSHANVTIYALDAITVKLPGLQALHLHDLWFMDGIEESRFHTPNPFTSLRPRLKKLILNCCASNKGGPVLLQTLYGVLQTIPADAIYRRPSCVSTPSLSTASIPSDSRSTT